MVYIENQLYNTRYNTVFYTRKTRNFNLKQTFAFVPQYYGVLMNPTLADLIEKCDAPERRVR